MCRTLQASAVLPIREGGGLPVQTDAPTWAGPVPSFLKGLKVCLFFGESCLVKSDSSQPHGLYSPWNSAGQNTGVGSLSLLQGIFPTQGLNPGLWHCRQILYQLSHKGSPRRLWWVAYPFSRVRDLFYLHLTQAGVGQRSVNCSVLSDSL